MRTRIILAALTLMALNGPALARITDTASLNYPGAPKRVYDDPAPPPYAMNFSEETAQALGTHAGGIDLTSAAPGGYAPAVSMGSGAGAPMLKLQWRP